jgi:hypothetical protein
MERDAFTITATPGDRRQADAAWSLVMPLVACADETVERVSASCIAVRKPGGRVVVEAHAPLRRSGPERIFNHVPGLQAVKLMAELPPGGLTVRVRVGG